jgi:hypothetical protein
MTLRVNFLQIVCPIFVRSIDIDFAEKESIFTNKKYVCKQQNFYREQKKNILKIFLPSDVQNIDHRERLNFHFSNNSLLIPIIIIYPNYYFLEF